ncbi:AraC family transcriptional regulator [Sphingopyxis sp. J-6]|uniref:helix-turn-helix domain-containing protein n=1 Tax=Sphingopyxis sp. J-6 TaxID=3122054 RepID=UPI003984045C
MTRIDVSPEMVTFYGRGTAGEGPFPERAHAFVFDFAEGSFHFRSAFTPGDLQADADRLRLVLIVAHAACERLRGQPSLLQDNQPYHMPAVLRSIVVALRDCALPEGVQQIYRGAKCIELLCETMRLDVEDLLLPNGATAGLSIADSERLLAARRVIEERSAEKLTIEGIARMCGLNRGKLTRGFRELFDCSVADAIAEQRLSRAGNMLLATDLPISSIGYRCGYLNNASFTRAFSRHFGIAPTRYRAARVAA